MKWLLGLLGAGGLLVYSASRKGKVTSESGVKTGQTFIGTKTVQVGARVYIVVSLGQGNYMVFERDRPSNQVLFGQSGILSNHADQQLLDDMQRFPRNLFAAVA